LPDRRKIKTVEEKELFFTDFEGTSPATKTGISMGRAISDSPTG